MTEGQKYEVNPTVQIGINTVSSIESAYSVFQLDLSGLAQEFVRLPGSNLSCRLSPISECPSESIENLNTDVETIGKLSLSLLGSAVRRD